MVVFIPTHPLISLPPLLNSLLPRDPFLSFMSFVLFGDSEFNYWCLRHHPLGTIYWSLVNSSASPELKAVTPSLQ